MCKLAKSKQVGKKANRQQKQKKKNGNCLAIDEYLTTSTYGSAICIFSVQCSSIALKSQSSLALNRFNLWKCRQRKKMNDQNDQIIHNSKQSNPVKWSSKIIFYLILKNVKI